MAMRRVGKGELVAASQESFLLNEAIKTHPNPVLLDFLAGGRPVIWVDETLHGLHQEQGALWLVQRYRLQAALLLFWATLLALLWSMSGDLVRRPPRDWSAEIVRNGESAGVAGQRLLQRSTCGRAGCGGMLGTISTAARRKMRRLFPLTRIGARDCAPRSRNRLYRDTSELTEADQPSAARPQRGWTQSCVTADGPTTFPLRRRRLPRRHESHEREPLLDSDLQAQSASAETQPPAAVAAVTSGVRRVREALGRVIVGQNEAIDLALVTLLAGGHALIEGVPGVGKRCS